MKINLEYNISDDPKYCQKCKKINWEIGKCEIFNQNLKWNYDILSFDKLELCLKATLNTINLIQKGNKMLILEKRRSESLLEEMDYKDALEIYMDNKLIFSVFDGEPEDSNLSRDFSDCNNVFNLMEKMYNAGKNGIDITFKQEFSDEL
jgi:hypothetical protein